MDEIRIEKLTLFAHHGVFPQETQAGQTFVVSAVLEADTRAAGRTDDLSRSTDYGAVCQTIAETFSHTHKLIEAAAEETAHAILMAYPLVRRVELTVEKPQAPIPLEFETVSVTLRRGWNRAFVALGSNLGDKLGHLSGALEGLREDENIRLLRTSSLIVTAPYGGVEQDSFLNGVAEIETLYDPHQLLEALHRLEGAAHRVRKVHWGPRTLDLDILFYGQEVLDSPDLVIPHIDLENRDFVLRPMAEIAPGFRHPVTGKTMAALWRQWQEEHPCS